MRKISLISWIVMVVAPSVLLSQVTTQQVTITPAQLLLNNFVGEGITISNVEFKSSAGAISSNQIGTFTNADTSGLKIKATSGIVMATSAIDCSVQTGGSTATNTWNSTVADAPQYSAGLGQVLTAMGFGPTTNMYNIAVLSFDFISEGENVAFKYCFSSEEYPNFVCSTVNDAFGFFISGPFHTDGSINWDYGPPHTGENIAIIPGTTDPVTINSVNGGTAAGSQQPCILTNSQYFVGPTATNGNTNITGFPLNGCTTLLQTKQITVEPCQKYHLELAICNTGDAAYQSAVFLEANSFVAERLTLGNTAKGQTSSDGSSELFVKGCSETEIRLSRNMPATNYIPLQISFAGDAIRGTDYEVIDEQGELVGATVTFFPGDTVVSLRVMFFDRDPNEPVGNIKNLIVNTASGTLECQPQAEPLTLRMVKIAPMSMTTSGSKAYCEANMPKTDVLTVDVQNSYGDVEYTWSYGNNPYNEINNCVFYSPTDVYLTVTDVCSRLPYDTTKALRDTLRFEVDVPHIDAFADKDKICEGDSLQLHASESTYFLWSSGVGDNILSHYSDQQDPWAQPMYSTYFKVLATDSNGCQATDSVFVMVVPAVDAQMLLNPTETTFLNPNISYEDATPFSFYWYWDFGDGTSSTDRNGIHTYSSADTGTYDVMLVAYNEAHCPDTAYGRVRLKDEFAIYFPTGLLAGNDGASGLFRPYGSGLTYYEIRIYNRWGTQVFYTNELGQGWDGRLQNGEYAPNGTYAYDIIYKDGNGLSQRKLGTVNIVRADKQ
ncbi:MAG: choice-of-anchor L domain-containing protein [Bacteroidales bacterium]|jgi:hypothetical protein|nr:choice-of-anchor L domain-containing protein [Bacteroidales bacterium]